ncbi:MAG: hypothetical protein FD144_5151 [Rhodospirillaceae bacterium]|nr:MAG: hypothetical protein FD144_5151 [Rhodospirillaceae bacterium]
MLPFTREQFLGVLVTYNDAIWPLQIVTYLSGIIVVALLFRPSRSSNRIIAGVLAAMWVWTGIAYHGLFFAPINTVAYLFAALFLLQGGFLAYAGVQHDRLHFGFQSGPVAWMGAAFLVYATILYPLIGMSTGHAYPEVPMFGVTPCPVTMFTFGMLLLTTQPLPRWLLVIPFVWSLIGGSAAIVLGVTQDWLVLVSGFIAVPLIVLRDGGTAQLRTTA